MKKKWTALALGLVVLAAVGGVAVRSLLGSEKYQARLREIYDGAVLSALRQMEDVELMLNKALLSGDPAALRRYLGRAGAGAAQVQRSISLLPLDHAATRGAVKFANQVTDYTNVLLGAGEMTDADAEQLTRLAAACADCTRALQEARAGLSDRAVKGEDSFYAASDAEAPAYDSGVSYPTLIYDGPFSDAADPGPARGLGQKTVTREEALALAREFLGADAEASPGADMGGSIPCWGVTLRMGDLTLEAAVTKTGGKILWMTPDSADFERKMSLEQCRDSAVAFLSLRGFEGMESTYFQVYGGLAVISFAATQGDTLLYPDQIKVQLRMDTAQVVGIEARNYWQNHRPRGALVSTLTEEEARQYVNPRLAAGDGRLCLIPTDGGEKLCWEFRGSFGGQDYLSYINARDGRQEELLQVVESDTGIETV